MKNLVWLLLLFYLPVVGQSVIKDMHRNKSLVIAHRGTTYGAPEETEAAMRWARNVGADYLEFDLQRTKDGILIALHDEILIRTTDVALKFPLKKDKPVSEFTYEELLSLDAGTWFNLAHPDKARTSFSKLDILTLTDIAQIAEGKRVSRNPEGKRIFKTLSNGRTESAYEIDPSDNGNRPGLYIETKNPSLFPGIELDLEKELKRLGWYHEKRELLKRIKTVSNKVNIGNSTNRVILQTFSIKSLAKLNSVFQAYVPKCLLLWRGEEQEDIINDDLETFKKHVEKGKSNGASIVGPSISGEPNNYTNLLTHAHYEILRQLGFKIHAYSFDTESQFTQYQYIVDGMFTNQANETLKMYNRISEKDTLKNVLQDLGY